MIKIYGSLVIKNEKDRYLESCINWMLPFVDELFVYDDRSDDGSAELAADLGCRVARRKEENPSFIEHEGKFRQTAWNVFQKVMEPQQNDWILSFDADEFLVSANKKTDPGDALIKAIIRAEKSNSVAVVLPFPEIFKIEDGDFYYRIDGLWNTIRGTRLFRFKSGGHFKMKPMGCGSEPEYVSRGPITDINYNLNMLHLGYARDEDKEAKYKRYSSLSEHGHNNSHVESIIKQPKLKKWEGQVPKL